MSIEQLHADVTQMLASRPFLELLAGNIPTLALRGTCLCGDKDLSVLQMMATWAVYRGLPRKAIEAVMENSLNRPFCFTIDDLVDSVIERLVHIRKDEDGNFVLSLPSDEEIEQFGTDFRCKTLFARATSPISVGEGGVVLGGQLAVKLWRSQNEFEVELVGAPHAAYDPLDSDSFKGIGLSLPVGNEEKQETINAYYAPRGQECVFIRLSARCTKRALEKTALEIGLILRSVWRSLGLVRFVGPNMEGLVLRRKGGTVEFSVALSEEQKAFLAKTSITPESDTSTQCDRQEFGVKGKRKSLDWICATLSQCLDYYYLSPSKKDTLERRMRNAIRLIAESDRQENPAIHLSLCFAAVEALVCTKQDGIVDQLSRNVATLLQPDSIERLAAMRKIKKLYDLRSKVLHGAQVEIERGVEHQARRLAAGVLTAMMEWRLFAKRMGEQNQQVPEFFEALEEATVAGRRFVGVPDQSPSWLPEVGGDE